ncbi:uncharacterized protein LOC124259461 [Haliotis rubra]|uniref:uncharacterized protein LOC124259461 n=1 Tax=Haliotis rubra TaxID=36100 RepID=UPI001EE5DCFC|nr:uncharacterized protein LOC124259461 [Haliotis rubra]
MEDSPVYEVKPEDGIGRTRVLHRNMLLPCDGLPVEKTEVKREEKKIKAPVKKKVVDYQQSENESDSSVSSDLEDFEVIIPGHPQETERRPNQVSSQSMDRGNGNCTDEDGEASKASSEESQAGEGSLSGTESADPPQKKVESDDDSMQDADDETNIRDPRPQRRRRRYPTRLTYDTLGNPTRCELRPTMNVLSNPQPVLSAPLQRLYQIVVSPVISNPWTYQVVWRPVQMVNCH